MQCPCCGGAESIRDTRDISYTHKGEETVLPGIEGNFCPTCGEIVLYRGNSIRVNVLAGEFIKRINKSDKTASPVGGV